MANLNGVYADLRLRVERVILLSNNELWVSSGFRTRKEQEHLYALYLAGGTLAAKPGMSNHERGFAVDVGCLGDHDKLRSTLAKTCGLITPIRKEPWHMELDPKRKPLPVLVSPNLKEASVMVRTPCVKVLITSTGNGYYIVANDGGVFCYGDAEMYGAMGGKPLNEPIIDACLTPTEKGYILLGADGGVFCFGDAPNLGNPREHVK